MGGDVTLIDSGRETAIGIKMTLEKLGLLNGRGEGGNAEYFVTNNPETFDNVAKVFMGEDAHVKSILKGIEE
jgi:glutamate racemase